MRRNKEMKMAPIILRNGRIAKSVVAKYKLVLIDAMASPFSLSFLVMIDRFFSIKNEVALA